MPNILSRGFITTHLPSHQFWFSRIQKLQRVHALFTHIERLSAVFKKIKMHGTKLDCFFATFRSSIRFFFPKIWLHFVHFAVISYYIFLDILIAYLEAFCDDVVHIYASLFSRSHSQNSLWSGTSLDDNIGQWIPISLTCMWNRFFSCI